MILKHTLNKMHSFECKSLSLSLEYIHTLGSIMLSVQCLRNVRGVDQINSSTAFISKQSYGLVYQQTSCAIFLCFPTYKGYCKFHLNSSKIFCVIFYIDKCVQKEPIRIYPCESNNPLWTCRNIAKCARFRNQTCYWAALES